MLVSCENRMRRADDLWYMHSGFLHCAFHAQFDGGSTPKLLLGVLDRLGESVPMMKNIWEFTAQAGMGRDEAFDEDMKKREKLWHALDAKQIELDSLVFGPLPGMVP
jgi:hypothetical protein